MQDHQREQASGAQQQPQWDPANPYRDWELTRRVNPLYPVYDAGGTHIGYTRDDAAHAAFIQGLERLGAQEDRRSTQAQTLAVNTDARFDPAPAGADGQVSPRPPRRLPLPEILGLPYSPTGGEAVPSGQTDPSERMTFWYPPHGEDVPADRLSRPRMPPAQTVERTASPATTDESLAMSEARRSAANFARVVHHLGSTMVRRPRYTVTSVEPEVLADDEESTGENQDQPMRDVLTVSTLFHNDDFDQLEQLRRQADVDHPGYEPDPDIAARATASAITSAAMISIYRAMEHGELRGLNPMLEAAIWAQDFACLLYTSPSPRDKRQSRMPSSA